MRTTVARSKAIDALVKLVTTGADDYIRVSAAETLNRLLIERQSLVEQARARARGRNTRAPY